MEEEGENESWSRADEIGPERVSLDSSAGSNGGNGVRTYGQHAL